MICDKKTRGNHGARRTSSCWGSSKNDSRWAAGRSVGWLAGWVVGWVAVCLSVHRRRRTMSSWGKLIREKNSRTSSEKQMFIKRGTDDFEPCVAVAGPVVVALLCLLTSSQRSSSGLLVFRLSLSPGSLKSSRWSDIRHCRFRERRYEHSD